MSQSEAAPDEDPNSTPINLIGSQGFDFVEHSYLTYMIPMETSLDLEKAFKSVEPGKSVLDSIQQRDSLFFGWSIVSHDVELSR